MDLSSKRFELVLTDESLQQIPLRDASLKQQVYVGLCDVYPNVRVAIPQHKTAEECVALARSILNTKQVMRTVRVVLEFQDNEVLSHSHCLSLSCSCTSTDFISPH